jgi:PEP-CTERM motif
MTIRSLPYLFALAVLSAAIAPHAALADILYTNLGPGNSYDLTTAYAVTGSNLSNQVIALPFSPTSSGTVSDILLALRFDFGANVPANVYLELDDIGAPGPIAAALTQNGTLPDVVGSLAEFDCSGVGCDVTFGSTYWVVAQQTGPNTEDAWFWVAGQPSGPEAFNSIGSATGPWTTSTFKIAAFQVESANAVPEPGSRLLLLGMGLLGVLARRRFAA